MIYDKSDDQTLSEPSLVERFRVAKSTVNSETFINTFPSKN